MIRKTVALLTALILAGLCAGGACAREESFPPTQPEEIAAWIEEAMGVYAWFSIWPLGGDLEEPMEEGASEYYRVLDERYNTRLKLAEFALGYFSMEIVTELFDRGLYEERDGVLYVSDRFEIIDENISSVEYEVAAQGEGWIEYLARVFYLSGTDDAYTRDCAYRCELDDGRWVFTQFDFYWERERNSLYG